jgi:polar amino acid transport system substrate-binding protein
MGKKKSAVLILTAMMIAVLALAGCSTSTGADSDSGKDTSTNYNLVESGKLTVAASLDFPPFENLEGSVPVGYAIELMDLIAEEMGLEAQYLPSTKFDTIVTIIASGKTADVGTSSITITDTRKKEVDFTDPYMDSNQSILVMKDSDYSGLSSLEGKKIGAQSGSTGYDWAEENIANAEVTGFDEMTAVFLALQSGQIDAIAVDLPVGQYYVKNAYPDVEVVEEIPTGEQYAMVVSKSNPDLTEALNKALAAIKTNGKYDELYTKWFG